MFHYFELDNYYHLGGLTLVIPALCVRNQQSDFPHPDPGTGRRYGDTGTGIRSNGEELHSGVKMQSYRDGNTGT